MISYILRRIVYMLILLWVLSVVSFLLIQLPPGDFLDTMIEQMRQRGLEDLEEEIRSLEDKYGLDLPIYQQYWKWFSNFIRGDMGQSFIYQAPVSKLIAERLPMTMLISFASMLFVYAVAIPIGIYSATHQYSILDYFFIFLGFIGLATPDFLLALALMIFFYNAFGWSAGGLFSPEYQVAGWSFGKVFDLLKHLIVPVVVIGTDGTAGMIRVLRGTLLDELNKQYVITARAKGLKERKLLFKYPIRMAINPLVSGFGGILAGLVSGSTLVSIVISLPTVGPLLLSAVMSEDMYMAGSITMFLGSLGLIGILISDLLLVVVDPRISFIKRAVD